MEETAAKEALQVAYLSVQNDYEDLEGAAVATCQGVKGEGGSSGSLLKAALRHSVQKALSVVSMHYIVNFEQLATGYIVPDGDDDAKVDAMEQADAAAEGTFSTLSELFEGKLLPGAVDDEDEGAHGGEDDL